MDLKDFRLRKRSEDGAEVALKDPNTGEPLGATLRVRGTDSRTYQAKVNEQRRARLEKLAKTRSDRLDPEELDAETLERIVAATLGWSGIKTDGQEFPFSPDNARALYSEEPWILEQAIAAIADRANFLPRPAKAS